MQLSNPEDPLYKELLRQCRAMARHALDGGKKIPGRVTRTLTRVSEAPDQVDLRTIIETHEQLSALVSPATPRSIALQNDTRLWGRRYRVPNFLVLMAVVCVVCFVGMQWSAVRPTLDFADNAKTQAFYASAAGIGVSFYLLFVITPYTANRTYDTHYDWTYLYRWVLGILSGVILANFVHVQLSDLDAISQDATDPMGMGNRYVRQAFFAMLGGYSAQAVNRILGRMVEAVESIVGGKGASDPGAEVMRQQVMEADLAVQARQERVAIAADLMELQDALAEASVGDISNLRARITRLTARLIGDEQPRYMPEEPPAKQIAGVEEPGMFGEITPSDSDEVWEAPEASGESS